MKKYRTCLHGLIRAARTMHVQALIALILTVTAPFAAHAAGTSNGITGPGNAEFRAGLWWDPALNGSGWEINRGGDVVFGIWYTYNEDGTPTWYIAQGSLSDGRFEGDLLSFTWDYTNNKVETPTVAGSVSIDFLNQQLAEIHWQLGEQQSRHTLRPFIFSATPTLTDYSGSWFDPEESGYGITLQTQGDITYAVLYYYDDAGYPTWSAGINEEGSQSLSMLNFKGSCPWCEYTVPSHSPAGELLPEFHTETTLSLDMTLPEAAPLWTKSNAQHVMISDPPSGRPHAAALANIASGEALAYYFRAGFLTGNGYYRPDLFCPYPIVSPPRPTTPAPGSEILSSTNVQEAGVDEADVVKATTDYLYSLDFPLNDIPLSKDGSVALQSITRYLVSADGDIPVGDGIFEVSLPRRPGSNSYLQSQGLYLHTPASGPESRKLIYLASQLEGRCGEPIERAVFIQAFEVGSETDFLTDAQLKIEGELVASRKIGDHLFVATTFKSDLNTLATAVLGPAAAREFSYTESNIKALFDLADPKLLTPSISYPDGSRQPLVTFENIMMPPLPLYDIEPVLTTLSMFDLNDLDTPPVSIAIMGKTNGIYATPESVYFASSRNGYVLDEFGQVLRNGFADTDIHKIAISENSLEYRGSGTIEGTLDDDPERLAWRMSEHKNYLRVISSQGWQDRWGDLGDHRLTILKESEANDLLLSIVSVLPNARRPEIIGKPGELIHGVRFQGERGYVVTFQRVDPLYALDMSVPTDPRVLGELEVEGFSDYLHPVGDHLLIGIGMQAETWKETGALWFQGVQVGLFDVSELAAPVLLHLQEIGHRGTSTSVMDTHRAFTFLPGDPANGKPMRFIIPISEHAPADGILEPDPSQWYPWKSTGILMFEVNERADEFSTLDLVGHANVASIETVEPDFAAFYQYPLEEYSRSVIYGDQVFHYFRGGLFMTHWAGGEFTPAENCPLCTPGQ